MLDIKFIRENKKLVEKNSLTRNVKVNMAELLKLDEEKINLQKKIDARRGQRNTGSKTKPTPEQIVEMKKVGEEIKEFETVLKEKEAALQTILIKIPNINHESTPVGKDDSENKIERTEGKKPKFDFEPKEHFEVGHIAPLIDLERGAKTSGSRFYYLRGKLAILERAIMQYAVDIMVTKGFELILPPILVREQAMFGTGFFPADKNEVYAVNPGEDNLYLIGTSEVPLIYMHAGETLESRGMPKKYIAVTPCFRRESGAYGKDTKGIIRVHQFYKVEMVVYAHPEKSEELHNELLAIEEEFIASLGLAFQVVNVCSGDLGFPAAKKYDCEGWFPGQNKFRELTSTSNTTDYQTRRSNIKYKTADGSREFVHTLNGTVASDRPMLAIIENFQQADGSILIPKVLQKYTGFDKI
ncbi:MAG: serine--tRNA ligase [Candidatus Magasanikbacteria bacterium]|nr:serine--tRNA ligase [Candidatus Magasanikbacteria bacterium]